MPFSKDVEGQLVNNKNVHTYAIIVPSAGNVAIKFISYIDDHADIKLIDNTNQIKMEMLE